MKVVIDSIMTTATCHYPQVYFTITDGDIVIKSHMYPSDAEKLAQRIQQAVEHAKTPHRLRT